MGFFRDILGGGGDLHRKIMPSALRGLAPKEVQPGGFDPARDWFGYDIKANPERDAMLARQAEMDAANANFQASGGAQVPGLLGMAPPQSPLPTPQVPLRTFAQQAGLLAQQPPPTVGQTEPLTGSFDAQAQQLSGLLGNPSAAPLTPPFTPGRFMPGWQPGDPLLVTRGGGGRRFGQVRPR